MTAFRSSGEICVECLYLHINACQPKEKIYIQHMSISIGQFEESFHQWLCTCPKIAPAHEWAREFQEDTKITWDLITRASFRIPSYMIAITQLAAMKFVKKFAFI